MDGDIVLPPDIHNNILLLSLVFKIPGEIAGIIIVVLTTILSAYSLINSLSLNINEIEIPLNHLNNDMKIVQLSDIHIGSIRNSVTWKRL